MQMEDFVGVDISKCNVEIHLGHIHTNKKFNQNDFNGILVRYLPSMCGTDRWHRKNWYYGNQKCGVSLIYSYDGTDIQEFNYIVK